MDFGDELTRWTIRLAMLAFAMVLAGGLLSRGQPGWFPIGRWLWTLGCLLFLGHLAAAFHYYHHWSHAHAFADTAAKTKVSLGTEFGWGIYVNHLFAVVWAGDVLWSWLNEASYRTRPTWISWAITSFMLFIAINGLTIFKDGPVRWVAVTVLAALALLWAWQVFRSSKLQITSSKQTSKV